jgi:L-malate glycosyltransferase
VKICFIADGTSVHTKRWLNYFASRGVEIHLICWKNTPGFDPAINIHRLKTFGSINWPLSQYVNFISWCLQTKIIVNVIKPDILDGHFITTYGFIAARANYHPLVVTVWGSDILILPKTNPLLKYTAKYAMQKADQVICTGNGVKNEIVKLGISEKKIQVIVIGGVDNKKFYPFGQDKILRAKLGIGTKEVTVISTRSLAPVYDIETLLKAIPVVVASYPDTKFLILGKGKQENYLHILATNLGIDKYVKWVGWVEPQYLPHYLASSDIYVSTSLSDGTSNCLLEAMASGLASVVTDIPANRQWIQDAESGYLFPVKDHSSLSKKIVELAGNGIKRKLFGRAVREKVVKEADPDEEMQKLLKTYSQLKN